MPVFPKWIFPAGLCLLLTACGPNPADLQFKVDLIQKQMERQVIPSDATLIRGIHDCELIILGTTNSHALVKSQTALGPAGQAVIFRYRHQAAVFLANLPPEKQSEVAAANPLAFPHFDPAHPETAFEFLPEDQQ